MANPFHTIPPCKALQDHVACYYFLKTDDENFSSRHYSFPHTYNALSIYKNVSFETKPSHFSVRQSDAPNLEMFIQVKKQAPLMVNINGKINRVTILFKDFGINHFIDEPLAAVMGYNREQLSSWKEDPLFLQFITDVFDANSESEKAKIIDKFLLHRYRPMNLGYLQEAVKMLCDFEQNLPIETIAAYFDIPLRSFNRKFKEVLGVSPVEYRRIAQFRQSLQNKLYQTQFNRLTDIGYQSHFYDQSYFNKIYQKLTGSNPKKFFNSIERIGDDQLIFQFIKK